MNWKLKGIKFKQKINKEYLNNQLQEFADRFNPEKIKQVDYGRQDIRGGISITLIDKYDRIIHQEFFADKWGMIGYIQGYNHAKDDGVIIDRFKKHF